MKKDKDFSLTVNSPLITGKMSSVSGESPLLNSPFLKKRHISSINSNDLSFQEKSVFLGKYGFLKPIHIGEINTNINNPMQINNSFNTESPYCSSGSLSKELDHIKSPSKFSISKKNNNNVIKLNFTEQQCQTEELTKELQNNSQEGEEEQKLEDPNKHKRNHSAFGIRGSSPRVSLFKKAIDKKLEEDIKLNLDEEFNKKAEPNGATHDKENFAFEEETKEI